LKISCYINKTSDIGSINSNSNIGIGIDYLNKMELEFINLELRFATKNNPQMNLPFSFRIISSITIPLGI